MEMQTISCYEKLRLQNIERNQLFLRQLGLESIVAVPDAKDSRPKRKLEVTEEPSDLRRSHRLASFPATTSFEEVSVAQLRGVKTELEMLISGASNAKHHLLSWTVR